MNRQSYQDGKDKAKELGYTPKEKLEENEVALQDIAEKVGLKIRMVSHWNKSHLTINEQGEGTLFLNYREFQAFPMLATQITCALGVFLQNQAKAPINLEREELSTPKIQEFAAGFLAGPSLENLHGDTLELRSQLTSRFGLQGVICDRAIQQKEIETNEKRETEVRAQTLKEVAQTLQEGHKALEKGEIKSVPWSDQREKLLVHGLEILAKEHGVKFRKPLRINTNGEFHLIAENKEGKSFKGACGSFKSLATILNQHQPRTGFPGPNTLDENDGWCRIHHFQVEKMITAQANKRRSAAELIQEVETRGRETLVIFRAEGDWCKWCNALKDQLENDLSLNEYLKENGIDLRFETLLRKNEDPSDMRTVFRIKSLPTLVYLNPKERLQASTEYLDEAETKGIKVYQEWIRELRPQDALEW